MRLHSGLGIMVSKKSTAYREVREIEMKHKVEMALEEEARVE